MGNEEIPSSICNGHSSEYDLFPPKMFGRSLPSFKGTESKYFEVMKVLLIVWLMVQPNDGKRTNKKFEPINSTMERISIVL
jgi:hypothetical protein